MGLISTMGGSLGSAASSVNSLVSLFTSPMIGGTYKLKTDLAKNKFMQGLMTFVKLFGIPVFTDRYSVKGGNEISEQTLITSVGSGDVVGGGAVGALVKIADNIVVSPRVWTLHGYMGFSKSMFSILSANPVLGAAIQVMEMLGRDALNLLIQNYIQETAEARQPFKFITSEGEAVPSLFKDYEFTQSAENQNFLECDFTIQEFRYIALTDSTNQISSGGGMFSSGVNTAMVMTRTTAKFLF